MRLTDINVFHTNSISLRAWHTNIIVTHVVDDVFFPQGKYATVHHMLPSTTPVEYTTKSGEINVVAFGPRGGGETCGRSETESIPQRFSWTNYASHRSPGPSLCQRVLHPRL